MLPISVTIVVGDPAFPARVIEGQWEVGQPPAFTSHQGPTITQETIDMNFSIAVQDSGGWRKAAGTWPSTNNKGADFSTSEGRSNQPTSAAL